MVFSRSGESIGGNGEVRSTRIPDNSRNSFMFCLRVNRADESQDLDYGSAGRLRTGDEG